jgi:hypothetical protein
MIWWVKGLMNHPILSDGTNVELLCTHTRGRGSIKVERHSRKREYAIVIRECKASELKAWHRGETPQT